MTMFFFSSRRRHTRFDCDWSSDVCSSDLVLAVFNKFTDNGTVDKNGIAIRIVAANLALALAQETVVTHPVGELMRQPGAALWTIVIGTRCAHFQCKRLIPMNTLRTIRHIETVLDTQARMRLLHFPRELVG